MGGATALVESAPEADAKPGATRPARPLRWSADAFETGPSSSRSRPLAGSKRSRRMRPLSTTAVTPGSVTEVSATLVARMTRRRVPRASAAS